MTHHPGFEVRPVARYAAPRYPTTCLDPEPRADAAEVPLGRRLVRLIVCALLVAGLALLLIACGDRARLNAQLPPRLDAGSLGPDGGPDPGPDGGRPQDDAGPVTPPDGGDILLGDSSECTPGDIWCADAQTLVTCEQYAPVSTDCNAWCQATHGPQSESAGCNMAAAEPCQCYDLLDGGMAECTPGQVQCPDATHVTVCDPTTGTPATVGCGDYCVATLGAGAVATAACDPAQPQNACGCVLPE